MPARIKSYVVHYAYGLFAAAMTGATADARVLNANEMAAAFPTIQPPQMYWQPTTHE